MVKYEILEYLKNNKSTSAEISKKIGIEINNVRNTIRRMVKNNEIEIIGKKSNEFIYSSINNSKNKNHINFNQPNNTEELQKRIENLEKLINQQQQQETTKNPNETLNKIKEMFENRILKVYGDKLTPEYRKILKEL